MKKLQLLSTIVIVLIFCFSGVVPGFAKGPPPEYFIDESKLPFDALPDTDTVRYWGVHGGAGYRIEVPSNWNGELVLYCHGYRGEGLELTVSNPSIRGFLITNGYAWAASSYSKNAYDVKAGVKDTHALAMFFNGMVAKPSRRYIIGHSMGGHITGVSIEQYPKVYDGALPMCGVKR
jgi:alpha-beta hydrolase superfamily lysophospholipase